MGPFEKIDNAIEQEAKKIEIKGSLPSMETLIPGIKESQSRQLNLVFSMLCVFIPFLIAAVLLYFNLDLKKNIGHYNGILKTINELESQKVLAKEMEAQLVSRFSISDKNTLQTGYQSVLSRNTKTQGSVTVRDFVQNEQGQTLLKTEGTIEFNNFAQSELTELLKKVLVIQKMKLSEINIYKLGPKERLRGELRFVHYGKTLIKPNEQGDQ